MNNRTDWTGGSEHPVPASDFAKNETSKLEVLGEPIEPEAVSRTTNSEELNPVNMDHMDQGFFDAQETGAKEQALMSELKGSERKGKLPETGTENQMEDAVSKEPEKKSEPESKPESEPEIKSESELESEPEIKSESELESKPDKKTPKPKPEKKPAEKKPAAKKTPKKKEAEPPARKRSGFEKAVSAIIFILLLGVSLRFVEHVLEDREGTDKVGPFLELETSPDVLLVGTSHVSYGIFSPILWRDYGITSYNLGSAQATMPMSYWRIRLALEYSDPKLIVLDCSKVKENVKTSESVGPVYWGFDAMPLSKMKAEAVRDLLDDPYYEEGIANGNIDARYFTAQDQRELFPLLFNFITYHNRWKTFTPERLENTDNQLMGNLYSSNVGEAKTFVRIREEMTLESDSVGFEYLRKIAELCKSRDIQLVLTYLPFGANITRQRESRSAELLAEELGVPFVNFLDLDVIDCETDLSDQSHLNAAGGKKVTKYLGDYLSQNFRLTDRRGDSAYQAWDDALNAFDEMQLGALKEVNDLESYLMMLNDPSYDAVIEFYDPIAFLTGKIPSLLRGLGIDPDDIEEDAQYILVRGGEEADILYGARGDEAEHETILGTFLSQPEEEADAKYSLNGTVLNISEVLSDLPDEDSALVRICVMEHGNPENVIDTIEFCRTETQKVNVSASRKRE